MRTSRIVLTGLGVVAALAVAGCQKQLSLSVTNATPKNIDVTLDTPQGQLNIGRVAPGQTMDYQADLDKNDLPARVAWRKEGDKDRHITATITRHSARRNEVTLTAVESNTTETVHVPAPAQSDSSVQQDRQP